MMKNRVLFFVVFLCFSFNGISQVFSNMKPLAKYKKQEGAILSIAFQPDGNVLVSGSDDKTLLFRSFPDGKEIKTLSGFTYGPKYCFYTTDSKYLIVAYDKIIRVLSLNGEHINQFAGTATHIWSFSFNPVTNKIVMGSYDRNLRAIDFTSGKPVAITGHQKNSLAVAFSPDNKLLATGSLDETVKLWDALDFKPLHTFTGHGGNIYNVLFTKDSKKLLSASSDNSIRVWDIESRKWEKSLLGSEGPIMCMALSPDGYYLVSGASDGTLKLWDILRNECILTVLEHNGPINTVAFSPDGKYVASGGQDKLILIWELSPEIFVNKYYSHSYKNELDSAGLFLPKSKDESKENYKLRQDKAQVLKIELINKYYQLYLSEIKGRLVN